MEVVVRTGTSVLSVDAGAVEVARLLSSVFGYMVDMEPTGQGEATKLTATHCRTGAIIRANGTSVVTAAEKLIDLLTEKK